MAIKYSILGLLHYKDMHGYRIKKHIEQNFGHMWTINYGQIYPNLRALREEGLVTMKEVDEAGQKGPARKLYSITPKGREVFLQWLESDPEGNMLLRDPFLMRFVFLGFGDRDRAVEMIDRQIEIYKEQLKYREGNRERWQRHDAYVQAMAQLGVTFNEMFIEWLKKAREDILAAGQEEKNRRAVTAE